MYTTDILERIVELINDNPNDSELGSKIRSLYLDYKEKISEDEDEN